MIDVRKGVRIILADDVERFLYYTARDAKEVAKAWSKVGEASDSMDVLAEVLLIGLRRGYPELTHEQLLDIIPMHEQTAIGNLIAEAMGMKPNKVSEDVTVPLAENAPTSKS